MRSVMKRTGIVDRLPVAVAVAPTSDGIIVFQGKTERVDARMAIRTRWLPPMSLETFTYGETVGKHVVRRNGAGIRGRWRHGRSQHAAENPITPLHGARP